VSSAAVSWFHSHEGVEGDRIKITLGVMSDVDEMESTMKKLRWPIPLRGFEQRLYAAVVLSIVFGIAWSISARDWQYFERSGSLVIVAAVTMAWRDHVQMLGRVERFYQNVFKHLAAELGAKRPSRLIATTIHDAKCEEIKAAYSDIDQLIAMLKQRLRTTEAAVLCLGTFIWGYGSPIGNLLWSFK
jgi:hypothetical protein